MTDKKEKHTKAGFEDGTERYKEAKESAAALLAKGVKSKEERDALATIWDKIYYDEALTRLFKSQWRSKGRT